MCHWVHFSFIHKKRQYLHITKNNHIIRKINFSRRWFTPQKLCNIKTENFITFTFLGFNKTDLTRQRLAIIPKTLLEIRKLFYHYVNLFVGRAYHYVCCQRESVISNLNVKGVIWINNKDFGFGRFNVFFSNAFSSDFVPELLLQSSLHSKQHLHTGIDINHCHEITNHCHENNAISTLVVTIKWTQITWLLRNFMLSINSTNHVRKVL